MRLVRGFFLIGCLCFKENEAHHKFRVNPISAAKTSLICTLLHVSEPLLDSVAHFGFLIVFLIVHIKLILCSLKGRLKSTCKAARKV